MRASVILYHLWELHQIYRFGALGVRNESVGFRGQKGQFSKVWLVSLEKLVRPSPEFIYVFLCILCIFYTAYFLHYYEHGGVDLMGLKPNP